MKSTEKNTNPLTFVAFVAIIIFAVLQIFSLLSYWGILTVGGYLPQILETIKNVCVCIVIGCLSYRFVANKGKGLKITFWVCLGIIILGTVLIWINVK